MCTASSLKTNDTYFGRTLDYESSYGEKVVITPRSYPFNFRHSTINNNHYAIIGMAHIADEYPMYYDAMNEYGLGMAGLNFVGNAKYNKVDDKKENVAQYELIAYILSNCKNVLEAKSKLESINVVDTQYNENYPCASLHYILRDSNNCIVVEFMSDGTHIYDNKTGCMTNNPPFNYQLESLEKYSNLSNKEPDKNFSFSDKFYSRGLGALGLPGDLSSQSRFIRVAFATYYSHSDSDEVSSVNQFFHVLETVFQTRGLCKVKEEYEITIYTSCMNLNKGIYYYKTYNNSHINGVNIHNVDLNTNKLFKYELVECKFNMQN